MEQPGLLEDVSAHGRGWNWVILKSFPTQTKFGSKFYLEKTPSVWIKRKKEVSSVPFPDLVALKLLSNTRDFSPRHSTRNPEALTPTKAAHGSVFPTNMDHKAQEEEEPHLEPLVHEKSLLTWYCCSSCPLGWLQLRSARRGSWARAGSGISAPG